jgi:RecA-family ATPase
MATVADDPFAGIDAPDSNVLPFGPPPEWMDQAPPYPEPAARKPPKLDLLSPADWADKETPARVWAVSDYIPDGQATLLTGKGAAGKSLASQQQCTSVALGLPFLGIETLQRKALYITCEDDQDELERRQKSICAALGISLEETRGRLHLLSLLGEMGNELATFETDGRIRVAPRYEQIREACLDQGITFLVLDNTAHLFTGNENDRHQVAAFINLCNRLAIEINGAVVIVGHPNKAGDSYSGSTAWENQVRSRLFMEIPTDDNGNVLNPDERVLRREKANYAQRGGELRFVWHKGAFARSEDLPEEDRRTIGQVAMDAEENDRFMRCLATSTAQRRAVGHQPGVNYFATIFTRMTEAGGMKKEAFERAFERLLHLGRIELDAELWRAENRHIKRGIKEVKGAPTPAPTPASTPRADPRQPHGQVVENTAPTLRAPTPLYTTYNGGAGPEAEPPSWMDEVPPYDPDWADNPILNRDWEGER